MKFFRSVALSVSLVLGAANVANAQTHAPVPPPSDCRPAPADCQALQPEVNDVNHVLPGAPRAICTGPTYVATATACNAAYRRRCQCAPTVVVTGNRATVDCNGAPVNTQPRRVSDRLINVCREDMGLVTTESGNCALRPNLPTGYNYAIVTLSTARPSGALTERLRVSPHAIQVTYGGIAWPNGQPRPQDNAIAAVINRVVNDLNGLTERVTANEAAVNGLISRADQNDARDNEQDATDARHDGELRDLRNQRAFRFQFDGALGGLVYWNAGQPIGALGGGGLLRVGGIFRWNDSFGLRVYGGWGMGNQSNAPYHIRGANGMAVEQSAPLHLGTFGLDAIIGDGAVSGLIGLNGTVAGRTAPALLPGDVSGLLNWSVNVQGGARFRLAGENNGVQVNLDVLVNAGVNNASVSAGGRFFSPLTFGLGGGLFLGVTR